MKKTYLIIFSIVISIAAYSQQIDNKLKPLAYYQQFSQRYQDWLDYEGLGDYLRVLKVAIGHDEQQDTALILYLDVTGNTFEEKLQNWFSLRQYYNENKGFKLPYQLFKSMLYIYKVPPDKANLQVCIGDFYYYKVYYDAGKLAYDETSIRSIIKTLPIRLGKKTSKQFYASNEPINVLYDKILSFLERKYKKKGGRVYIISRYPIEIKVKNLRNEVLPEYDAFTCFLARLFSCDRCSSKEVLIIKVSLQNTGSKYVNLQLETEGYYSTCFAAGGEQNYNNIEEDFGSLLEDYTNQLFSDIEAFLNK